MCNHQYARTVQRFILGRHKRLKLGVRSKFSNILKELNGRLHQPKRSLKRTHTSGLNNGPGILWYVPNAIVGREGLVMRHLSKNSPSSLPEKCRGSTAERLRYFSGTCNKYRIPAFLSILPVSSHLITYPLNESPCPVKILSALCRHPFRPYRMLDL